MHSKVVLKFSIPLVVLASYFALSGCSEDILVAGVVTQGSSVSAETEKFHLKLPKPKSVPTVRMSASNGFKVSVGESKFELALIGRKAGGRFTFWDPSGKRAPAPGGGFGPEGADTILIINQTGPSQPMSSQFVVPLGADASPLTYARTGEDWFGSPGPSRVGETSAYARQFKLPIAAVRQDGTASFKFESPSNEADVLEEFAFKNGKVNSKYFPGMTIKDVSSSSQSALEVQYLRKLGQGESPYMITGVVELPNGQVSRVTQRRTWGRNEEMRETFAAQSGRLVAVLVEKRRTLPIMIEGVPMAPKGLRAPVSNLPKRQVPSVLVKPTRGATASRENGWRGMTASGRSFSVDCITDDLQHAWTPDGFPISPQYHGGIGGGIKGPPQIYVHLTVDGASLDDFPSSAWLYDEVTGTPLQTMLQEAESSQVTGETKAQASFAIDSSKAPKLPVRILMHLEKGTRENLGSYTVASKKLESKGSRVSDFKITSQATSSVVDFKLHHPLVSNPKANYIVRLSADGSYRGMAMPSKNGSNRFRVNLPAPSKAFKNIVIELLPMEVATFRDVSLRRVVVNQFPK